MKEQVHLTHLTLDEVRPSLIRFPGFWCNTHAIRNPSNVMDIFTFPLSKKNCTLKCFVWHWHLIVQVYCHGGLMHQNTFSDSSGSRSVFSPAQTQSKRHVDMVLTWLAEADLSGVYVAQCSWEGRSALTSEHKLDDVSGEKQQLMI